MLARTALAAEMVSLWICISVPFFFRSVDAEAATVAVCEGSEGGGAAGVDCDEVEEVDDGSDVIRSINVVPVESCIITKHKINLE